MVRLLEVESVRLMTNNPRKLEALEAGGVRVEERIPHEMAPNPHNERYLLTKALRSGHMLGNWLGGADAA